MVVNIVSMIFREVLPMVKRIHKLIPMLIAAVLIFNVSITAFAAKLKVGSVKGLPEKLVVLDDKGRSVSENGEYFFEVEDMKPQEVYSKNIQIMNLREDASYRIYFNAQPLTKSGEIDLEEECKCNIYMNDRMIYYGKITGEGTPDMRDTPLNLGLYEPGDSRVLTVEIRWNPADHGGLIDNGAKVVDRNGTSVVREKSGVDHIEGDTTFKWIFTAIVEDAKRDNDTDPSIFSDPDDPHGGDDSDNIIDFVKTGDTVAIIAIGLVVVATVFMIFLTVGKKKRIQQEKGTNVKTRNKKE